MGLLGGILKTVAKKVFVKGTFVGNLVGATRAKGTNILGQPKKTATTASTTTTASTGTVSKIVQAVKQAQTTNPAVKPSDPGKKSFEFAPWMYLAGAGVIGFIIWLITKK